MIRFGSPGSLWVPYKNHSTIFNGAIVARINEIFTIATLLCLMAATRGSLCHDGGFWLRFTKKKNTHANRASSHALPLLTKLISRLEVLKFYHSVLLGFSWIFLLDLLLSNEIQENVGLCKIKPLKLERNFAWKLQGNHIWRHKSSGIVRYAHW
jgi:hypothetical protein